MTYDTSPEAARQRLLCELGDLRTSHRELQGMYKEEKKANELMGERIDHLKERLRLIEARKPSDDLCVECGYPDRKKMAEWRNKYHPDFVCTCTLCKRVLTTLLGEDRI